ncbi:MAG: hypothetical protein K0V04_18145 [Deltaproteobacteria bacterium]|nr:hypothetical protein [Deltaproteobacteria bacterium]
MDIDRCLAALVGARQLLLQILRVPHRRCPSRLDTIHSQCVREGLREAAASARAVSGFRALAAGQLRVAHDLVEITAELDRDCGLGLLTTSSASATSRLCTTTRSE